MEDTTNSAEPEPFLCAYGVDLHSTSASGLETFPSHNGRRYRFNSSSPLVESGPALKRRAIEHADS